MKAGKILLIIQTVFMYIAILMFIVAFGIAIALDNSDNPDTNIVQGLLLSKFLINFIPFP